MPATALKDYYNILEIPPEATVQEVKKAYRAMAFKYHPDAAPGDAYAAGYFHDVQEAYAVLSDEYRRKQYDNDRWLAGMADRARKKEQVSPMWILQETIKLNNHMAGVDLYRMNHRALQDYILQLLNNNHMAILTRREEPAVNEGIVNMLLQATRGLKHIYMHPVAERLHAIAGTDIQLQSAVRTAIKVRERQAKWEKRMPFVIALVTLLLVLCMYFWAAK